MRMQKLVLLTLLTKIFSGFMMFLVWLLKYCLSWTYKVNSWSQFNPNLFEAIVHDPNFTINLISNLIEALAS